jgi:hypothetical protein
MLPVPDMYAQRLRRKEVIGKVMGEGPSQMLDVSLAPIADVSTANQTFSVCHVVSLRGPHDMTDLRGPPVEEARRASEVSLLQSLETTEKLIEQVDSMQMKLNALRGL